MPDFAFDAVLFDFESTQVTCDPYWPDVARTATTRLFARLGIEREIPKTAAWLPFRGRPVAEAVDAVSAFREAAELSEAQATFAEKMWGGSRTGASLLVADERVLDRRVRVRRQGSRSNGLAGESVVRPRADAALLDDALVVDMTNPILPRIDRGRAPRLRSLARSAHPGDAG